MNHRTISQKLTVSLRIDKIATQIHWNSKIWCQTKLAKFKLYDQKNESEQLNLGERKYVFPITQIAQSTIEMDVSKISQVISAQRTQKFELKLNENKFQLLAKVNRLILSSTCKRQCRLKFQQHFEKPKSKEIIMGICRDIVLLIFSCIQGPN